MDQYPFQERLTAECKVVLERAARHAGGSGQEQFGAREILLALIEDPNTMGGHILNQLCSETASLRAAVDMAAGQVRSSRRPSEAGVIVGGAAMQARALGHHYVGTEHLLLSILKNSRPTLPSKLADLGVTYSAAAGALADLLGAAVRPAPSAPGRAVREIRFSLDEFPERFRKSRSLRDMLEMLDLVRPDGSLDMAAWMAPPPPSATSAAAARDYLHNWIGRHLEELLRIARDYDSQKPGDSDGSRPE